MVAPKSVEECSNCTVIFPSIYKIVDEACLCHAMHCGVPVPAAGLLEWFLPSECVKLLFVLRLYV